ncbi:LLM class F420-dependent oxidoreductase [Nocardiopsis sp. LOL_012]|uniref:LLM class F420-dependent oxidoreductase n=1 Tax=Nocardiopsis sp. LOL_012 TaxID=3345409 RepID=UPI003A86A572
MRLRIFIEPQQGATYGDQLAIARAAEELGFDALFRSDHYLHMGGRATGLPGPTDAWITLAGLARETSRIRLGTLMSAATFRLPGPLAIAVAQVDRMSGGRVEFGFGTGWYEAEHAAYGIPFPGLRERFDRYEEQLEIVTGLWETPEGGSFRYEGGYYRLGEGPALPKPAQAPRPPVLIGGAGKRRTPRLAARFADEYNVPFASPEETAAAFERTRTAVRAAGREAPMVYSAAQVLCAGRNEAEVSDRADRIGREVGELRRNGLAGGPDEVVDRIGAFGEAGADRIYLQVLDMADLDHLELVAAKIVPQLG